MKYSNLTYYLLAILCAMATSCVTDGVIDDCAIKSQTELIEGGKVNFAINFPTTSTRAIIGESDGTENERTVNDVQVYTFVKNQFVEKVQYILISGTNGDITRYVEGKLTETYTTGTPMDFVVIVNAESKGVPNVNIVQGDSKDDLYQQLAYTFDVNKDWSKDIPMWGEGTIPSITSGDLNIGSLTLQRAIAKVNVTVNDGNGLANFKITKVNLHNYNNGGYCAPVVSEGPSIPSNVIQTGNILSLGELSANEGNRIENKFYIPEHKNAGVNNDKRVYLTIETEVKGQPRTYNIDFKENESYYDVLRNYIYVFNITSVKMDIDVTPTLEYEVKAWSEVTVDIPSFN